MAREWLTSVDLLALIGRVLGKTIEWQGQFKMKLHILLASMFLALAACGGSGVTNLGNIEDDVCTIMKFFVSFK